jgi:cell division septum initiation protein DivIVA
MRKTDTADLLDAIANTYPGKTQKEARLKRNIKVMAQRIREGVI